MLLKKNIARARFLNTSDVLVLDVGCGNKPYYPFFQGVASKYIGLDTRYLKYADIIGDSHRLPFNDSIFDVILCTQVLEHVHSPEKVIDEIYRTLKINGVLFLSTHGVWPVHNTPNDYWRFTHSGLKQLLKKFLKIKIYPCGGSITTFFQIFNLYFSHFFKPIPFITPVFFTAVNKFAEVIGRKISSGPDLTINFLAIAIK